MFAPSLWLNAASWFLFHCLKSVSPLKMLIFIIYFLLLQQKHVIVPMLQNTSLFSIGNSAPPDTAVQNTEVIASADIYNYSIFIFSCRGDLLKCLVTDKKHWHGLGRSCIQYIC